MSLNVDDDDHKPTAHFPSIPLDLSGNEITWDQNFASTHCMQTFHPPDETDMSLTHTHKQSLSLSLSLPHRRWQRQTADASGTLGPGPVLVSVKSYTVLYEYKLQMRLV